MAGAELDDVNAVLKRVLDRYPQLSKDQYNIIDSRAKETSQTGRPKMGQLEFYPANEQYNPMPGRPTLEIFNPELKGASLETAIFGDLLHHAPNVVEGWQPLRQMLMRTITREQMAVDQKAYKRAQQEYGENRSFSDWFMQSRLDAYIRGYLAPDKADEWKNVYTSQQKQILEYMRKSLQRK